MESCEYRRDRACLAVGVGDGWRGRQDSRTLRMRGIWTGSSGGNEQAELGRKAGGSPRRTLSTRLSLELQRGLLRLGDPGVSRPGMCL